MTECTAKDCDNKAEFALWIGGEFSQVHRAHSSSEHESGDLHPYVCCECRPIYAAMFQLGEFRRVEENEEAHQ